MTDRTYTIGPSTPNQTFTDDFARDVLPQLDRVAAALALLELAVVGRVTEIKTADGPCFLVQGGNQELMSTLLGTPLAERDGLTIYSTGKVKAESQGGLKNDPTNPQH